MIRTKPLPRTRTTARTHRCIGCNERISTSVCPTCRTRATTKRTNISKRCDALWSLIVRFPGRCVLCGNPEVQAAHIVGRAQRVIRWSIDPMNGLPLCHQHHREFDSYKLDRDSLIRMGIGGAAYDALMLKAQGVWDKQYPLEALKARLKELKEAKT